MAANELPDKQNSSKHFGGKLESSLPFRRNLGGVLK
jgi:hypothetical protein